VRRGSDEDAAMVAEDCGWPGQVVREDGAFVENSIAIGIFEYSDASQMRDLLAAFGVIDHFHDEHASALVEGEGNRADDVWLASDQLDVEAFLDLERFEGLFRLDRGNARQVIGGDGGFGCGQKKR